jgi:hypothetical protein
VVEMEAVGFSIIGNRLIYEMWRGLVIQVVLRRSYKPTNTLLDDI